jgi:putative transposase
MVRIHRIDFPGAIQNVCVHGVHGQLIFLDDADRLLRLQLIEINVVEFDWIVIAFVFMDNHEHLLVITPRGNLAEGMHKLNGEYARRFNRRHVRKGHLFDDRYYSHVVEGPGCLAAVSRYFDLNPCRAGIVTSPELYPWGSCQMYFDPSRALPWLDTSYVLGEFVGDRQRQRESYQEFVLKGLTVPPKCPWQRLHFGRFLGRAHWARRLAGELGLDVARIPEREIHWGELRARLEIHLPPAWKEHLQGLMAWIGVNRYGLTQREIATPLGFRSQSGISRALGRMELAIPMEHRKLLLAILDAAEDGGSAQA